MPGLSPNPGGGRVRDPVWFYHHTAVDRASKRYGIPREILFGILEVEGGTDASGRPVKPKDGAGPPSYGQFTYGTGKDLGVRYGDSNSEVDAIARYLIQLGWKKDKKRAVAAYNGGAGNPQYSYADKVFKAAEHYDPSVTGQVADSIGDAVTGAAKGAVDTATALPKFLSKLDVVFDGQFWVRVGLVLLGIAALLVGILFIGKEFTPVGAIANIAKGK